MFGVILYTVNIQNICDKSIIYVDRELFGTDKLFHSHSINRNQAVSSLANKKMTFMEEIYKEPGINLEEWQQLLQIETIEFLLQKLTHTSTYPTQKTRLDSIKEKFNELNNSKTI